MKVRMWKGEKRAKRVDSLYVLINVSALFKVTIFVSYKCHFILFEITDEVEMGTLNQHFNEKSGRSMRVTAFYSFFFFRKFISKEFYQRSLKSKKEKKKYYVE